MSVTAAVCHLITLEGLAVRIGRGTSHYAEQVKALLERMAKEDLGLAVRQSACFEVTDGWPYGAQHS